MLLFLAFLWGLGIFFLILSKLINLSKHPTLEELRCAYDCSNKGLFEGSEVLALLYLENLDKRVAFSSRWQYRGTYFRCVNEGLHIRMNLVLWSRHFFIPWEQIKLVEVIRGPDASPLYRLEFVQCTKSIAVEQKIGNCTNWAPT